MGDEEEFDANEVSKLRNVVGSERMIVDQPDYFVVVDNHMLWFYFRLKDEP